jgi:hypothetical protein
MIDLTGQLPSSPVNGNTSMAASNTVSDQTGSLTAPGSVSEQTAAAAMGVPMVEIPPVRPPTVLEDGHSGPRAMINRGQWNNI